MHMDFRSARDRVAAKATRSGNPGAHSGIHYALVALLVAVVVAAAFIFSGFTPHELYKGPDRPAGTAGR